MDDEVGKLNHRRISFQADDKLQISGSRIYLDTKKMLSEATRLNYVHCVYKMN